MSKQFMLSNAELRPPEEATVKQSRLGPIYLSITKRNYL